MSDFNGNVLAFDVGAKRIGVAIAQSITKTASPLTIIANDGQIIPSTQKIIDTYSPKAFIVGYPLDVDNKPMPSMKHVRIFIDQLKTLSPIPIHTVNERFTTKLAKSWCKENKLKRDNTALDDIAASIILNAWLQS